jgi:arginase
MMDCGNESYLFTDRATIPYPRLRARRPLGGALRAFYIGRLRLAVRRLPRLLYPERQELSMPTLLGIRYDAGSSFLRGAAAAPPLIRDALWSPASNSWSELGVDVADVLGDEGDLHLADMRDAATAIEAGVARILDAGDAPLALGGDHSITYPILRAVRRRHPRLSVLHIDAHADLYAEFDGDALSHACPFARIMEDALTDRLVQVGVRTLNAHQREQAERFGVEVYDMVRWTRGERFELEGPVYLSVDVDAIDPGAAPGVSHREPGGLSVREVVGITHSLQVPIAGADLVEYNPARDADGMTAVVCAKLVKEIAARMALNGVPERSA